MLPLERITIMPKLYEYFGLIVMFYANEHEPVHVHGKCQGRDIVQDKNNLLKIKIKNCNYFERNRIARFVLS